MSEERIQEIKDSINFQYELIVSKGINKNALLFTDEEQELLEEVERLNNIIKEARECITSEETIEIFRTIESREKWLKINHKLLEILDKGK